MAHSVLLGDKILASVHLSNSTYGKPLSLRLLLMALPELITISEEDTGIIANFDQVATQASQFMKPRN